MAEPDEVEDEDVSLLLQQVAVEELGAAWNWQQLALECHTLGHGQGLLVQQLGVEGNRGDWYRAVEDGALVQLRRRVIKVIRVITVTRRYDPLRGPTSSSCAGLRPRLFFALRAFQNPEGVP